MTLVVKPKGRGNWHVYRISIDRPHDLFTIKVGDIITMGTWTFRVIEVKL